MVDTAKAREHKLFHNGLNQGNIDIDFCKIGSNKERCKHRVFAKWALVKRIEVKFCKMDIA
jgi:hypothetical protein